MHIRYLAGISTHSRQVLVAHDLPNIGAVVSVAIPLGDDY